MKKSIQTIILASLMTLVTVSTAMAQPKSNDIIPGSKGDLPTLQEIPVATENILPILHLLMVSGTPSLDYDFEFPAASTFE